MYINQRLKIVLSWLIGLVLLAPNFALAHHAPWHQEGAYFPSPRQLSSTELETALISVFAPPQDQLASLRLSQGACPVQNFASAGNLVQNALAANLNQPAECFNLQLADFQPQENIYFASQRVWPKIAVASQPLAQVLSRAVFAEPTAPFLPQAPMPAIWAAFAASAMGASLALKKSSQKDRHLRRPQLGYWRILRC